MIEVERVLLENGIDYKKNPNKPTEFLIRCFSGEHEDTNPSLRFDIEKGLFHCFACGFKGNTNSFMKALGIDFVEEPLSKQGLKIRRLQDKLQKIIGDQEVELPQPMIPFNKTFKGISRETLEYFKAFTTDYPGLEDYLCFPVYQNGKLKFIEGRYLGNEKPDSTPKYMRKPGGVDTSKILFPLDKVTDYSQIILVEGIFDAINLFDMGYTSTLCIFGTQNFGPAKAKVLDDYGCRRAIILMDGDAAGRKASSTIEKLLSQRDIETIVVKLPTDIDPGALTRAQAQEYLGKFFID